MDRCEKLILYADEEDIKSQYNDKILAYYFVNTFLRSFNIFNKVFLVYLSLVL